MDIRNDIYPMPEAEKYLHALTIKTQEAFPSVFSEVDDVIRYVNNFKNPKIAGLFLEVGNYYSFTKFYNSLNCIQPKQIDTYHSCKNTAEMQSFNVLISFIGLMEKLASAESSSFEKWVDFYEWVNRKDVDEEYSQVLKKGKFRNFKALMDSLKGRWSKEFASITKTTNFLRTIMSPEDKQALIKSIKYMQAIPEVSTRKSFEESKVPLPREKDNRVGVNQNCAKTPEIVLPACFENKKCWLCDETTSDRKTLVYCCDKLSCPLLIDQEKLDKCFKDTLKTIYEWRSKFIHDLFLPTINENVIYGLRYKGKYVIVELPTTNFKKVFEGVVKKFFDNYQVTHPKKKYKMH